LNDTRRQALARLVRAAVDRLRLSGPGDAPGAGTLIALYLLAHVEAWDDPSEVRRWLRNFDVASRTLREELRAIER
jgi:hypothetical protein